MTRKGDLVYITQKSVTCRDTGVSKNMITESYSVSGLLLNYIIIKYSTINM